MLITRVWPILLGSLLLALPLAAQNNEGILLLAHGGSASWDEEVRKVAAEVDRTMPVEVAFGMADKRTIQDALDRLAARNVSGIVAAPLFISAHSSVIRVTEYLLGLRAEAPPEVSLFASMSHAHGAAPGGPAAHDPAFDPTTPVETTLTIRMTPPLGRHPLVADILSARAEAISRNPASEVAVIVAHGPTSDEENALWIEDMAVLAGFMREKTDFSRVEYLTVRDDAPEPIRAEAAAELRQVVERAIGEGKEVLIVPLLVSFGGIESGIRTRLEGLAYRMSPRALLPDDRVAEWVRQSVSEP